MNARQLAAVHEAGHVVARVVRGLPLPPLVEIREDGTGETHGTGEQVRFDPFGSAVVALAGYVAEHRASGCRYEWTPIAAALSDPGSDADLVRCLVRDHRITVEHAQAQAESIVDDYWPQVAAIAEALVTAPDGILHALDLEPLVKEV